MIEDGLLVGATYQPTLNAGGDIKPKYICMYSSAESLRDLVYDLTVNPSVKESVHLIVDTHGMTQLAPFTTKTWHAGASYWQGHSGLNNFAIGICARFQSEDELDSVAYKLHWIVPEIVQEYNIRDIVSFRRGWFNELDVSPFKPYVDYGNSDSAGRFMTTAKVSIYAGPGVGFDKLDSLNAGEGVKILRYSADGAWAFILFERSDHAPRHGWTHESFLRRL